ncbi:MAG: mono/diheme cytochrome c family protein [Verrucomicrobiales bacterium]|jgi:mono/diheme cytochrome c family protein
MKRSSITLPLFFLFAAAADAKAALPADFLSKHCYECHDADSKKGELDLTALPFDVSKPEDFNRWVKIHDRIRSGEMPPKKKTRPPAEEQAAVTAWLKTALIKADRDRQAAGPRRTLRRMTRAEYENTVRDLLHMPGIVLQNELPADGSAHGFDKNSEALDISHVHLAKYMQAADRALDTAIATQPDPPAVKIQRVSLANEQSTLGATILDGDGVMLKNKQPDPDYPPSGFQRHLNYGAHLAFGMHSDVSPGASVGVFRHEDESFKPSFAEFIAIYPGMYRIRTAFWSFTWDKGKVLPSPRTEIARLDVWHITGDGRGIGHPNTVLGYFDAPSIKEQEVEVERWLNTGDTFGFNFTGSSIGHQIRTSHDRLMGFTGPGLACDGLEVEGPLFEQWPPASHRALFGDLPLQEFKPEEHPGVVPPTHPPLRQKFNGRNRSDPPHHSLKRYAVHSEDPTADAERLLGAFLPRAFRRPVASEVRKKYVDFFETRLEAGECFETALREAYRIALCSPDFLYHVEDDDAERRVASDDGASAPAMDDYGLAARLSYFLWNSMPDEALMELATAKTLHEPPVLKAQVERLLKDRKAERFREDFLGQWLKLRRIAANDPDPKLYGEFRLDLQDAMVAETHAYFQELLDRDLSARYLIQSDFAMVNERLARHYGIPGVEGSQTRRVAISPESSRGPFLTQASVLKVTANGTTTSPVPRGAFVMERLLGQKPEPPPANVAAVEPDVRGTTTIREQLDKHRDQAVCASCHAKIDPPGFALESFDVIGGQRERYRTITDVKPLVDPSGVLPDGRAFKNINEFQALVAGDEEPLFRNMAEHFAVYGTGRGLGFSDRDGVKAIVARTQKKNGGLRTLIHELVRSPLFQTR